MELSLTNLHGYLGVELGSADKKSVPRSPNSGSLHVFHPVSQKAGGFPWATKAPFPWSADSEGEPPPCNKLKYNGHHCMRSAALASFPVPKVVYIYGNSFNPGPECLGPWFKPLRFSRQTGDLPMAITLDTDPPGLFCALLLAGQPETFRRRKMLWTAEIDFAPVGMKLYKPQIDKGCSVLSFHKQSICGRGAFQVASQLKRLPLQISGVWMHLFSPARN